MRPAARRGHDYITLFVRYRFRPACGATEGRAADTCSPRLPMTCRSWRRPPCESVKVRLMQNRREPAFIWVSDNLPNAAITRDVPFRQDPQTMPRPLRRRRTETAKLRAAPAIWLRHPATCANAHGASRKFLPLSSQTARAYHYAGVLRTSTRPRPRPRGVPQEWYFCTHKPLDRSSSRTPPSSDIGTHSALVPGSRLQRLIEGINRLGAANRGPANRSIRQPSLSNLWPGQTSPAASLREHVSTTPTRREPATPFVCCAASRCGVSSMDNRGLPPKTSNFSVPPRQSSGKLPIVY